MKSFDMTLYIHEMALSGKSANNVSQVWCVVSVDGAEAPIATCSIDLEKTCEFNYYLNIQFSVEDVSNSYLYITACCFDENEEMVPLARAKTKIPNMPLNGPNAFRIPLMSMERPVTEVASVVVSGVIDPPPTDKQATDRHESPVKEPSPKRKFFF